MDKRRNVKDLSLTELEAELKGLEQTPYRARQIWEWVYRRGAADFKDMSNLPLSLRAALSERLRLSSPRITAIQVSNLDGTRKYLFGLEDGETVEAVFIPAAGRNTACLSSQVGCAFGCRFCASGLNGIKRDLTCAEVLDQMLGIKGDLNSARAVSPAAGERGKRITNIVIMGMGEPLANYDNVLKAIAVLNSPFGFGVGARKITLSTAGYIPGIRRLIDEKSQIELSVSLHGANDETRSRLMPINRRFPLSELMRACRDYVKAKKRIITFEYILIEGVNASAEDAASLSKLLHGLPCKVNLIPFNPVSDLEFMPPDEDQIKRFCALLKRKGVNATVRTQRGADIDAACGQLRLRGAGGSQAS